MELQCRGRRQPDALLVFTRLEMSRINPSKVRENEAGRMDLPFFTIGPYWCDLAQERRNGEAFNALSACRSFSRVMTVRTT